MPDLIIREYTEKDFETLVGFELALQQHIADLDQLKRIFADRANQEIYVRNLLKTADKSGAIFIAEINNAPVGVIVGTVKEQDEEEKLWTISSRIGRVEELYVAPEVRSHGVGDVLMSKIEELFKSRGCTVIQLGVFAPNVRAKEFYLKHGFVERYTDMLKVL